MDPLATARSALPVKVGAGGIVLGALSESSGWIVIDAVVGGSVGWLIAPKGEEVGYALGGAAATGLGGVLGLLGLLGWRYLLAPAIEGKGFKENPLRARDYVAVTHRGKHVAGPFRHYDDAKREADAVGGYVKFAAEARQMKRWHRGVPMQHATPEELKEIRRAVKIGYQGFHFVAIGPATRSKYFIDDANPPGKWRRIRRASVPEHVLRQMGVIVQRPSGRWS